MYVPWLVQWGAQTPNGRKPFKSYLYKGTELNLLSTDRNKYSTTACFSLVSIQNSEEPYCSFRIVFATILPQIEPALLSFASYGILSYVIGDPSFVTLFPHQL